MANYNDFEPEEVREIAKNFSDIQKLLIERKQIIQDAKNSPTHNKLEPHPKPKGDIYIPKNHKEKDGEKKSRDLHYNEDLKKNSKKIETAFHHNFEKADLKVMSDWAKEMDANELTIFIEESYDKVLEEREQIQKVDVEQSMKLSNAERDEIQREIMQIDFDKNSKDMDMKQDKNPSPSDDFEK